MRWTFFFCLFFCLGELSSEEKKEPVALRKTICLNMIVKNEKEVITRCLKSVLPIIDAWVIVDTGSTDGTQSVIREFMKGVPGELHERPWVNFGHNRNEALALAKDKADYILFMDADDVLTFSSDFKMPDLTEDFYATDSNDKIQKTLIPRLVKSNIDWRWQGAIHEYILAGAQTTGLELSGVEYTYINDGARAKDPQTLTKDLQLLLEDPKDPRNVFYMIHVYLRLNQPEKALEACEKRMGMGGWDEEVFSAQLVKGQIQDLLKKEPKVIKDSYIQAHKLRPHRLEPVYYLAQKLWIEEEYESGYEMITSSLKLSQNKKDILFVEDWIYDYGVLVQLAIFSAKTGRYTEGLKIAEDLLTHKTLPEGERKRVEECRMYIQHQMFQEAEKKLQALLFPSDTQNIR